MSESSPSVSQKETATPPAPAETPTSLTPEQRKIFHESQAQWDAAVKPYHDAIDASTRLGDTSIRMNTTGPLPDKPASLSSSASGIAEAIDALIQIVREECEALEETDDGLMAATIEEEVSAARSNLERLYREQREAKEVMFEAYRQAEDEVAALKKEIERLRRFETYVCQVIAMGSQAELTVETLPK